MMTSGIVHKTSQKCNESEQPPQQRGSRGPVLRRELPSLARAQRSRGSRTRGTGCPPLAALPPHGAASRLTPRSRPVGRLRLDSRHCGVRMPRRPKPFRCSARRRRTPPASRGVDGLLQRHADTPLAASDHDSRQGLKATGLGSFRPRGPRLRCCHRHAGRVPSHGRLWPKGPRLIPPHLRPNRGCASRGARQRVWWAGRNGACRA